MSGPTVRGAVAERQQQQDAVEGIETRIRAAREWFNTVVPSHIDGDQFVAMCIGALRRDPRLMASATQNPGPFMVAASECARLGLVPGETYHFVAFNNRETGMADITGIVDYKGEIDMIYRAGGVLSVHGQVVRAADKFIWRPGMELPLHEIQSNGNGQIGLADEDERGPLTGVYAYARLKDGGFSDVIVMSLSEVAKHEAVAKTDKFWKGPWRPDMFLKTGFHKLYDRVPHSQEYLAERIRAMNAPPLPLEPARQPAQIGGVPAVPGLALPAGPRGSADDYADRDRERTAPEPEHPPGHADAAPDTAQSPAWRSRAMRHINAMFSKVELGGERHRLVRLAVCSMLGRENPDGAPLTLATSGELTDEQVTRCEAKLAGITREEDERIRPGLLQLAQAAGWDGQLAGEQGND